MALFSKIVTSVFGKKSDKDLKVLSPYVNQINDYYDTLANLTDEELKLRFSNISDEFKKIDKNFKDSNKDSPKDDNYFDKLNQLRKTF